LKRRRTAIVIGLGVMGLAWLALHLARVEAGPSGLPAPHATPTALWSGLLGHRPAELSAPLPSSEPTTLDGAYTRHTTSPPQWWSCLRCADYRPSGGTWRILLDRGVLRIVYDVTGWRNLASYEVSNEELRIFNDPICPWEEGRYRWQSDSGRLTLQVVEDSCAFGLRAENLTSGAWQSCAPPDLRSAVSDAWSQPRGCAAARVEPPPETPPTVAVRAIAGDARSVPSTFDWMAPANSDNLAPPAAVEVDHAAEAVPYGLNVVLWEGGPWAEVTTMAPTRALGVQFWGPSTMGVARLLFDGEEVWRGDVSQLGRHLTLYGGYLEVSGFEPGAHTLRVEHLGADDRPLKVLFFGGR
jgi:hypothetical protein